MTPTGDVSPVPPTAEPTELYEILERFAEKLDGDDLSDLSRMCREYALNVHESRLAPALAEQRMATDSWRKKFNDLNEESLRLFREVERLSAPPVAPSEPSIYSHDENALPDNELPGMWEHADYEGGRLTAWSPENLEMARLFHDVYEEEAQNNEWESQTPVGWDDLPPANKRTMLATVARVRSRIAKTVYSELIEQINELESSASPTPSVGELEWEDAPGHTYTADEEAWKDTGERWAIWHVKDGDGPYCLSTLDGQSYATIAGRSTLAAAKSLANSLQRILSGAAEPTP